MRYRGYKLFLGYVAGIVVLLTVLYVTVFSLQFGPYVPAEYWIRDAYLIKQDIARQMKGKKMVIVAGSNGLFGIDSAIIERVTGLPTVNMSVHAGLGLDFILAPEKVCLKKGDVVVLPLELECYGQPEEYNDLTLEAIIAWDKGYYDHLSLWGKMKLIRSCSPLRTVATLFQKYYKRKQRYAVTPAQAIARAKKFLDKYDATADTNQSNQPNHQSLYQNVKLNGHGDIVGNTGNPKKITPITYGGIDSPHWQISAVSKASLTGFVNDCRTREIRVFVTWPCMRKSERFDLTNKVIRANLAKIKQFVRSLGVEMLGEPEDYYYESQFFFDTNYHLNVEGRRIRSEQLAGCLKNALIQTGSPKY